MASRRTTAIPLRLKPLGCGFASRPMPELVPDTHWRLTQNARTTDKGGCARFPGWTKYGTFNDDLHDQLLSLQTYYDKLDVDSDDAGVMAWPDADFCGATLKTRTQGRQPVTFMSDFVSNLNSRHFVTATQSRIYERVAGTSNYRILGDGFGGTADNPDIRFRAAASQNSNFVLFTNNYDDPVYWILGQGAHGCAMRAVDTVPDLLTIGLRKALVVFQFRGIVFLCNTEEDGIRKANMVRWSGIDPLDWIEDPGFSLAGHIELDYGEEILAGEELGEFAFIYTTKGVWQVAVSSDAEIGFVFRKIPEFGGPAGAGCIRYPYTFISDGESHRYMADDGVYEFSPAYGIPRRVEWIHDSSDVIYSGMNRQRCAAHTSHFNPLTKELFFSVAVGDDRLPSVTLYANARYNQCSKLDFGITASCMATPNVGETYRQWLLRNCICSEEGLDDALEELGLQTVKTGTPSPESAPDCEAYPTCIFTETTTVVDDGGPDEVTMEDPEGEESETAFCNFIGADNIADLCLGCTESPAFVFAHAEDYTIKELGTAFSRQQFLPDDFVEGEDAEYRTDGYMTRMIKGPMLFGTSEPKTVEHLSMEYTVAPELRPLSISFALGTSVRAEDPLDDSACNINWFPQDKRTLECKADDRYLEWPLFYRRESIYLDFTISGIGGDVAFSSLELKLQNDPSHIG